MKPQLLVTMFLFVYYLANMQFAEKNDFEHELDMTLSVQANLRE